MANPVSLAGTMPAEPVNGLYRAATDLMKDPRRLRLVVGVVDVLTITQKVAKAWEYPTVQFRHIELVDEPHAEAARELLAALLGERTGQMTLDFEPGDQMPPDPATTNDEE
jgi:hypothetical protein